MIIRFLTTPRVTAAIFRRHSSSGRFAPPPIQFYRVLLGFTEFYRVLPGFTGFYWVLLGFTGFYWVLLGFTGFYWVLPGFTGFYRVLPSFYRVLLGFTGFYRVLPGFTGFYRVSLLTDEGKQETTLVSMGPTAARDGRRVPFVPLRFFF